jgi:hypothetical protein
MNYGALRIEQPPSYRFRDEYSTKDPSVTRQTSIQLKTLHIRHKPLLIHGPFKYHAQIPAIKQAVRQTPAAQSVDQVDAA